VREYERIEGSNGEMARAGWAKAARLREMPPTRLSRWLAAWRPSQSQPIIEGHWKGCRVAWDLDGLRRFAESPIKREVGADAQFCARRSGTLPEN
jgi:hypothetical protein